jgi:cell division protein FtsW (lipid II flippase)
MFWESSSGNMKYYLLFLLFVIMGAGARTMFEIAHQALGREHDFAPAADTTRLIFLALWFIVMMVADVVLIRHKDVAKRNLFIVLLSLGVFIPVIYKLLNS